MNKNFCTTCQHFQQGKCSKRGLAFYYLFHIDQCSDYLKKSENFQIKSTKYIIPDYLYF